MHGLRRAAPAVPAAALDPRDMGDTAGAMGTAAMVPMQVPFLGPFPTPRLHSNQEPVHASPLVRAMPQLKATTVRATASALGGRVVEGLDVRKGPPRPCGNYDGAVSNSAGERTTTLLTEVLDTRKAYGRTTFGQGNLVVGELEDDDSRF